MIKTGKCIRRGVVLGLGLLLASGPVMAGEMNFCDGSSCVVGTVSNASGIIVQRVKVTQKPSDGCSELEKVHEGNLIDPVSDALTAEQLRDKRSFDVSLDPKCGYHFKFVTSSGCTGDKDAQLTPDKLAKGEADVKLRGGCGTLKAYTAP